MRTAPAVITVRSANTGIGGMQPIEFHSLHERFPLTEYVQRLGVRLRRSGWLLIGKCPIHQEEHGEAFNVDPRTHRWRCWGKCGRGGDVIDLEQALRGGSLMDAISRLERANFGVDALTCARVEKPRKATDWNWREQLRAGSERELLALASNRDIAIEGVREAHSRGLLRFSDSREGVAWVITDQTRKQAIWRRLDGRPWDSGAKAKLLLGCSGKSPIGVQEAVRFHSIAAVEGGPDLLSALGHAWADGCLDLLGVICMPNAGTNFSAEDLAALKGRRCRIFHHADEAGIKAAGRWCDQLEPIAAALTVYEFHGLIKGDGESVKDLNDLARINYDSWESNRVDVEGLMSF